MPPHTGDLLTNDRPLAGLRRAAPGTVGKMTPVNAAPLVVLVPGSQVLIKQKPSSSQGYVQETVQLNCVRKDWVQCLVL